jgi:hypothetical protein
MNGTSDLNNNSAHSNQNGSDDGGEGKIIFICDKQCVINIRMERSNN